MNAFTYPELPSLLLEPTPLRIAAAESLTCGHLQALLGGASGASRYFLGGLTAYSLEEKTNLLKVDGQEVLRSNGVSEAVARSMAEGVCRLFLADLGLATTGYAEPSPANQVKTPFAFWAIAHRTTNSFRVLSGRLEVSGLDRVGVQKKVAHEVVRQLIQFLDTYRKGSR